MSTAPAPTLSGTPRGGGRDGHAAHRRRARHRPEGNERPRRREIGRDRGAGAVPPRGPAAGRGLPGLLRGRPRQRHRPRRAGVPGVVRLRGEGQDGRRDGAQRTSGLRKPSVVAKEEYVRARTPDDERAGNLAADARRTLVELLLAEHPVPCKRHQEIGDCELELLGEKLGLLKKIVPTAEAAQARQSPAAGEIPQTARPPAEPLPRSGFQSVFTPRAYDEGRGHHQPDHRHRPQRLHPVRPLRPRLHRHRRQRSHRPDGQGLRAPASAFDNNKPMGTSSCVNCGGCMIHCPTGAITYSGGTHAGHGRRRKLDGQGDPADPAVRRHQPRVPPPQRRRGRRCGTSRRARSSAARASSAPPRSTSTAARSASTSRAARTSATSARNRTRRHLQPHGEPARSRASRTSASEEGEKRYIPIDAGSVDLSYDKPLATVGERRADRRGRVPQLPAAVGDGGGGGRRDDRASRCSATCWTSSAATASFRADGGASTASGPWTTTSAASPVFRDLPEEFIDYLRDSVELVGFNPGEVICRQGETADAFYLVRMGHVKVYENFADGQGLVLSYLSRSQYLRRDRPARRRRCASGRRTARRWTTSSA